jgi:hypothetical protein
MRRLLVVLVCGIGMQGGLVAASPRQPLPKPEVAALLEDNGAELLKQFTNPGGDDGVGSVETAIVFSGKSSVKIVPFQRYHNAIPGWKYRITEKPKPGEYRYVRFAWKAEGCFGIMIQFAHETKWGLRYLAGHNPHGWPTLVIGAKPPAEWTVITRDMFKDFGEHTLTGIALTVFGGKAGYFDHIYLGRTLDDLDRVDATGLQTGKPVVLTANDLDRLWKELVAADASRAYLAFWTLVADPPRAVPFLEQRLAGPKADLKHIKQWIADLDDDKFAVRDKASKQLAQHLDGAIDLLEQALENNPSAEVSLRVQALLALYKTDAESDRLVKAVRILEYTATPAAVQCLQRLVTEAGKAPVRKAAAAALKRLKES